MYSGRLLRVYVIPQGVCTHTVATSVYEVQQLFSLFIVFCYSATSPMISFLFPAVGDLPIGKIFLAVLAAFVISNSLNMKKLLFKCFTGMQDAVTRAVFGVETACKKAHFYELVDRNMKGEQVLMSTFKGSILCVVNIASK